MDEKLSVQDASDKVLAIYIGTAVATTENGTSKLVVIKGDFVIELLEEILRLRQELREERRGKNGQKTE